MPASGPLRHRITIQKRSETRNEYGERVDEWTTHETIWASIQPLSPVERWQAQQVKADVSHRIVARWCEGVKPDMRIKYGDRIFDVNGITNENERNRTMVFLCRESV